MVKKKGTSAPKDKKSIIDFYLEHDRKYFDIYGPNSLVILESGHFMEVYDHVSESRPLSICQNVLNIMVTRRDKSDPNSPYMAGIPTHSIKRYYNILLKNNYTVIVITQVTPPPTVTREVTKILSPGCNLSEDIHSNADYGHSLLVSLLIEIDSSGDHFMNVATFDSNIGETHLQYVHLESENYESGSHQLLVAAKEILDKLNYNEVLINVVTSELYTGEDKQNLRQKLIDQLELQHRLSHFNLYQAENLKDYYRHQYQSTYLEKVFPKYKTIYNHIKENLDLATQDSLLVVNLMLMYDFISIHDSCLISNLNKPIIQGVNDNFLKSFNGAYAKLNIFNCSMVNSKAKSLFDYLNFTSTVPGRKKLVESLKNPLLDEHVLNQKYTQIEELVSNPELITQLEDNLKIVDLERIYRRFNIGKLNPYELPRIEHSNLKIKNLLETVSKQKKLKTVRTLLPNKSVLTQFSEYRKELDSMFDYSKCQKTNLADINLNFFKKGYHREIDSLDQQLEQQYQRLEHLASWLGKFVDIGDTKKKTAKSVSPENYVSVRFNDKDGHWLDISTLRGKKLKDNLDIQKYPKETVEDIVFETKALEYNHQNKSNIKISSHQIKKISRTYLGIKDKLLTLVRKVYLESIQYLFNKYYFGCIEDINQFITHLDVLKSNAKCAYLYKYTRPIIKQQAGHSEIRVSQVRHPIIERILADSGRKYVPNDLYLGPQESNLIYGVNSVGKSSLLKSIALCIIMAQSGMYVAASECQLSLYQKVFTRMGNDDNLYSNHSSFVKEMTESREIIQKCDSHSLVIADELCASTETESALKIVCSIIKILSEKQSSFLFATHLFKITECPLVQQIPSVKYKHLKVDFQEGLVFERTLRDGLPENRHYGILVANKIIQESGFSNLIHNSDNFSEGSGGVLGTTKSKYNQSLYLDQCSVCQYQPQKETDIPLETHHINMQCAAVDNYHGIYHQNELHNLVSLCKSCHQNVHQDKLIIKGYQELEHGPELDYQWNLNSEKVVESKKKRKKYDSETLKLIQDYYQEHSYKTKSDILHYLKTEYQLKLSSNTLNKIISDSY
jgi:DNA mismatch repair protein MutS